MDSTLFLAPSDMYRTAKAASQETRGGIVLWCKPPCDCLECARQYRSLYEQKCKTQFLYAGLLSDAEAATLSQRFCTRLFEDLQALHFMLLSYGGLIQKRWLKKSNTKRKWHLKQLRPNMHESRNAFLDLYNACTDVISSRKHRDTFLLPYLTIENLAKDGSRLLCLLHYRVSYTPDQWVPFDNRQLHAGWFAGTFEEKFSRGCITMHGKSYGKFNPFNQTDVHNGDAYGVPRALLILEAQSTQARFLLDFASSMVAELDRLTEDEASKSLALTAIRSTKPPQLEQASWMRFGISYYNEPFSSPPVFDDHTIDSLIEIVSEKQAETHDHLWLLQTDPDYFHEFVSYSKAHSAGAISGAKMTKEGKALELESRVMCYSVTQAQDWNYLAEELQCVKHEYETHRADIGPGRPLPEAYDRALGCLELFVVKRLTDKTIHLNELTVTSPAWKSMWEVDSPSDGDLMSIKWKGVNGSKLYKTDHILYCLMELGTPPDSAGSLDIALILKSLDLHLGSCGKEEAKKIDSITYNRITDMAGMYRIMAALRMHRPSSSLCYKSFEEVMRTRDNKTWRPLHHQKEIIKYIADPRQFRFRNAFDDLGKFKMPAGKKSQEWLDSADSARKAVSEVWSMARENYKKMYRAANINTEDTEDVVQMLSHHDSPRYQATVAQERKEILAYIKRSTLLKEQSTTSTLHYHSAIPHTSTLEDLPKKGAKTTTKTKAKAKTRRSEISAASAPLHEAELDPILPPKPPRKAPSLPLPKKAKSLETLRLLFPTAISDLQGQIQWIDFIATMREIGFHGEHRGGSEWTFRSFDYAADAIAEPDEDGILQGKRSIVIHQPHPDTKMGAVSLQWVGKRLWRRFGWGRDCFQGL